MTRQREGAPPPTAAEVLRLIQTMTAPERERLAKALDCWPNPLGDYVCVHKTILDHVETCWQKQTDIVRYLVDLLTKYGNELARRNRKPSQKSIRTNAELCRLRDEDPDRWSLEKLRRKYGFKHIRSVTKILADAEKWLLLASKLGQNPGPRTK
jgi:hypothetical protein